MADPLRYLHVSLSDDLRQHMNDATLAENPTLPPFVLHVIVPLFYPA